MFKAVIIVCLLQGLVCGISGHILKDGQYNKNVVVQANFNDESSAIHNIINDDDVPRQDCNLPEPTGQPVVFDCPCDDNIQAKPWFDILAFSGVWHEIESYPKEDAGGQCRNHQFEYESSTIINVRSNHVNSNRLVSNNGKLTLVSSDNSARFSLHMDVNGQTTEIPYWILETDYTNYALAYSCMDRPNGGSTVYSWKLSKQQQLSTDAQTGINAVIASIPVLDQRYFEPVSQSSYSCFYLPDIEPGNPVILPGRCESNLEAVQNFDAEAFSGRWFHIDKYYDGLEGSCIDERYVRNGNAYDIELSQVNNRRLETTTIHATLAADNSGKLTVTTDNESNDFLIVGVDYRDWALLYSCQDVGTNERHVRSWMLSRSKGLSAEAVSGIEAIIQRTDVLDHKYFHPVSNSEQGCFYLPEPNGRPVRFRARCDQSIPVEQNFDPVKYLDTWYAIETYPQPFQDGECISALYEAGNDGEVLVHNTQVVDKRLDTIDGKAVLAADDGSAKLSVTFVVNGITVTSPYWVLATDYETYSFVYSCSEIDSEYVSVSAWKLSRTKTLTDAAKTRIDSIMNTIPVLEQQYFEPVLHTEEACFYYPDFEGGPILRPGQCPNDEDVDAITDFNPNRFSGIWHEVSRLPSALQNGECASGNYFFQGSFRITQNIIRDETLFATEGVGELDEESEESTRRRGVIRSNLSGLELDVYILDTDYESALLYSCKNVGFDQKQIYSWIISRSRDPLSQDAINRIEAKILATDDLFIGDYRETDQSDAACFYYPDFNPEDPPNVIEIPGACDNTIRGIPNFRPELYLGRWIEVERYPQPNQLGTCPRAHYDEGIGRIEIENTEVVNRELQQQTGTAVLASNDQHGELDVTFVVNGVTVEANYIILDTDYENYALVYSCRNLPNGNRQVSSWKLSRRTTLGAQANENMNRIIASTHGLHEKYYLPTGQSNDDCFYYPEPNPEAHVVFRGECQDIRGMQDFDIQKYLGLWHEVERYPTDTASGHCVSSTFTSSADNEIQVVDKSVTGLAANTVTNAVVATADGRLTRTVTVDGATVTSEVRVLATDYETYALLYSCETLPNNEHRRVWSAKHSRTRTLPETAVEAISGVVANINVLDDRYYNNVDQSDSACFHYPAATGQPVILPGQCDEDIPVVQDFAIDEYTGTWYQIERYPQVHESGNCSGARYTVDGDVHVLNWQVVDGKLDTIEGVAKPMAEDNSARFIVELPVRVDGTEIGFNVTSPLYVLRTDYTTYALTYSCVNINEHERQLGVWKLSRTREMPATGAIAITAYMASRPELDQRYFITTDQDEDCPTPPSSSYYAKSSLIMMLICSILQFLLQKN